MYSNKHEIVSLRFTKYLTTIATSNSKNAIDNRTIAIGQYLITLLELLTVLSAISTILSHVTATSSTRVLSITKRT